MPITSPELLSAGEIDSGWAEALEPVAEQLAALGEFLRAETVAGRGYLPRGDNVLRAFRYPLADVRVLVVGQDPYPTPGHSIGLAFAVDRAVRPLPRSLHNIYRELHDDTGTQLPSHGDLSPWAAQGVMLLNRVLTVQPGNSGAHRRKGWEAVTALAIRTLVARRSPLVAILWGNDARSLLPLLDGTPVIQSVHPSPLSAARGFFGSKPFSRANQLLAAQGAEPIDWSIPG
jgi:uracil-DNA glycosylase